MKVINPVGRKPISVEDFKSYTCICHIPLNNQATVRMSGGSSGDNCITCFHSCEPGNTANSNANAILSMNKGTV